MNDDDMLRDAFRGYEDQADQLSQARASAGDTSRRSTDARTPHRRMLMVTSTVVAVAAVVIGVALLAPGSSSHRDGVHAGGIAPTHSVPGLLTALPSPSSPASADTPSTRPPSAPTSPKVAPAPPVPTDRREMVAAFTRVLGNTATFIVTESHGNYLIGILTSAGRQGGFDIQADNGKPGDRAFCEDAATSHCKVIATNNGGSLSTGHEPVGSGLVYLVNYVGPDGRSYLMHLGTQADPKNGNGTNLASTPPLTIAQMVAILESDRW